VTLHITSIYAAILALFYVVLTFGVIRMRRRLRISILHDGNTELAFAIRRHSNFLEYVPLALILMALLELRGLSPLWLHVMGISLVVARLAHALGLKEGGGGSLLRVGGMAATLTPIIAASVYLLARAF
jgi:uncharacterized protein